MVKSIKLYNTDNVRIVITDFKLLNVSFYGCDARFYVDIHDKETDILLDTDVETIEYAFMGVDESDELYEFLESKNIDFSEQYDDDWCKLPEQLKNEYELYLLQRYNDLYHDYLFEDEEALENMVKKITKSISLVRNAIYVISDKGVGWINISENYFGIHLRSDDVTIDQHYDVGIQDWIYGIENIFFKVKRLYQSPSYSLCICQRDEENPYIVTEEDLERDIYPDYYGEPGDVLYIYNIDC